MSLLDTVAMLLMAFAMIIGFAVYGVILAAAFQRIGDWLIGLAYPIAKEKK